MHLVNLAAMFFASTMNMHLLTVVVVSAVAQCFLGALWYGVIFKKSWTKLVGFSEGEKQKNPAFGAGGFADRVFRALVCVGTNCGMGAVNHSDRWGLNRHRLLVRVYGSSAHYTAHLREPARHAVRYQCRLLGGGNGDRRRNHRRLSRLNGLSRFAAKHHHDEGQFLCEIVPFSFESAPPLTG